MAASIIIETIKHDIQDKPYVQYAIPVDEGELTFSTQNEGHPADRGYVLFDIESTGNLVAAKITFGLDRRTLRAFAKKLLEITK